MIETILLGCCVIPAIILIAYSINKLANWLVKVRLRYIKKQIFNSTRVITVSNDVNAFLTKYCCDYVGLNLPRCGNCRFECVHPFLIHEGKMQCKFWEKKK